MGLSVATGSRGQRAGEPRRQRQEAGIPPAWKRGAVGSCAVSGSEGDVVFLGPHWPGPITSALLWGGCDLAVHRRGGHVRSGEGRGASRLPSTPAPAVSQQRNSGDASTSNRNSTLPCLLPPTTMFLFDNKRPLCSQWSRDPRSDGGRARSEAPGAVPSAPPSHPSPPGGKAAAGVTRRWGGVSWRDPAISFQGGAGGSHPKCRRSLLSRTWQGGPRALSPESLAAAEDS